MVASSKVPSNTQACLTVLLCSRAAGAYCISFAHAEHHTPAPCPSGEAHAPGLPLQDTVNARREAQHEQDMLIDACSTTTRIQSWQQQQQQRPQGAFIHPAPFLWPAPRDPASYNLHPKSPSDFRKEELQQPWEEALLAGPATASG